MDGSYLIAKPKLLIEEPPLDAKDKGLITRAVRSTAGFSELELNFPRLYPNKAGLHQYLCMK
jgi:hypothetical protein